MKNWKIREIFFGKTLMPGTGRTPTTPRGSHNHVALNDRINGLNGRVSGPSDFSFWMITT